MTRTTRIIVAMHAFVALGSAEASHVRAQEAPESVPVDRSTVEWDPDPTPDVDELDEPHGWERPVRPAPRMAVLFYPLSSIGRGVSAGFEYVLPWPRFSVLGRFGLAFPAGGDFRSVQFNLSAEGRFYVLSKGPFTRWQTRAPVGLYVALRGGGLRTRLVDRNTDDKVGHATRVFVEATLGYRFTIAGRVEFSPYFGALFYADRVPGLPSTIRPSPTWGFSIGVLF